MKKINKIALLLTVCIVSVALVLVLAACDEPSDEHQHSWSAWSIATEPTQDAPGSVTRTCSVDGCTYGGGVQSVEIPALSSDLYTVGADTATCGEAGTKTYSVTVPGYEDVFTFSVVSAAKGNHTLSPKSAVEATCTKQGAEAYWECDTCHKKFSDENGANEISAPVATAIDPDKHTIVPHNRIEAKCNADGCEAYWECTDCGKLYKQPVYTADNEIEEPVVISKDTARHILTPHTAVEVDCGHDGVDAYWSCEVCHKLFSDQACEHEISEPVVTSKDTVNHTLTPHEEVAATCITNGCKAYWSCDVCNKMFSDAEANTEIQLPVSIPADSNNHNLVEVAASAETKTLKNSGGYSTAYKNFAYKKCSVCNVKILDDQYEVTSLLNGGNARSIGGIVINFGVNKVYPKSQGIVFQADSKGKYTIDLGTIQFNRITYLPDTDTTGQNVYVTPNWVNTVAAYENFVNVDDSTSRVTVNMEKGDIISFFIQTKAYSTVTVDRDPILYYGDNTVYIKSDDPFDENVYTFVPTESKYSMTVAEGLYVQMNGKELVDAGNGKMTVNFECTPGQEVTFSFSGSVIGTYAVTIGEFVKPLTLEVDTPVELSVNNDGAVLQQGQAMTTIVIDESVAAGTYKLTVSCSLMQAQLLLGLNYEGSANDFVGTTWLDGAADIYWGFNQGQNLNGNSKITNVTLGNRTGATATIELQAGDVLTFLTNNRAAFNVTLTLEAVA